MLGRGSHYILHFSDYRGFSGYWNFWGHRCQYIVINRTNIWGKVTWHNPKIAKGSLAWNGITLLILIFLHWCATAVARRASAAPFPGRWRAGASYECLIPGRSSADRKRPKLVNCGPAYNTRQLLTTLSNTMDCKIFRRLQHFSTNWLLQVDVG